LWSASKVLFLVLTAGSVKYSAIYGALGALPLIMLWTYLSWIIVLFGVTYTLANQTISTTRLEDVRAQMSQETLELVAVRLLALAAKRFDSGDTPLTSEALAAGTGAPTGAIHKLIRRLVETKLLQEVSGPGDPCYTPARSIESITLADVLFALRRSDASPDLANETSLVTLRDLLQTSQVDSEKELASWTFARVVEHLRQTQVPASTSDDDSPPSGQPASTSDGASPSS
ncbi:MAG: YihY/virulence factor BrkB family protein, partial [Deltaproteobacteria bacterium]|nr:YihY/virulence factor BrkB family protein [Deltaproteobacteria bacterium]